ncbi:MAG: alpha/beta fold hydrolase [Legionella sp.]|jgi:pimeloyl-[acyl-carrier protein] methyl ester esterase
MSIHLTSYGQGKPLVFFHGWGFDSQVWLDLLPLLQEKYQLLLVDFVPMDWHSFKTELLALLPAQFSVVGWSLGGLLATRLALEEPKRVLQLVNITSSPRFLKDENWPGVDPVVFDGFYQNLLRDPEGTLLDFLVLQGGEKTPHLPCGHLLPRGEKGAFVREDLEKGLALLQSWDLRLDVQQLAIPTAYFFGRLDPITPAKTMQTMQELYPNFTYVLFKKAAHMPFLSHTEEFINQLAEFIQ